MLFAVALTGFFFACSKDDDEDPKAEGKRAGNEMCDCVSGYTAPDPEDFADEASFQEAFAAYAAQLGGCPGIIGKYQQYVTFNMGAYNPQAEEPLYSIFDFKDKDFEKGFKEGTSDCMETFSALFALMGGQ